MKLSYKKLCDGLDRLYFLPLAENETIELRALAVDSYIVASGWTQDELIMALANDLGDTCPTQSNEGTLEKSN